MWPFSKKKSTADAFLDAMPEAVARVAENWEKFSTLLPMTAEVSLREKVYAHFFPLAKAGLQENFPEFRDSPDAALMMIVAEGIVRSGTHTRREVEDALGFKLPE